MIHAADVTACDDMVSAELAEVMRSSAEAGIEYEDVLVAPLMVHTQAKGHVF